MKKEEMLNTCLAELGELWVKMFQADDIVHITLYENYMLDVVKFLHDMELTTDNEHTEMIGNIYRLYMNRRKEIILNHMNGRWIQVEKDLPKNGSEVWVVLESTYGTGYRTYSSARYLYFKDYGESHWCDDHYGYLEWDKYSDGHGGSSEYKVIAWQPIEPYHPESEAL